MSGTAKGQAILKERFKDLEDMAESIEKSKVYKKNDSFEGHVIDGPVLLHWRVRVRSLLATACREDSEYYRQFIESEKPQAFRSTHDMFEDLQGVFQAAKDDFENGYLQTYRNLIQAELFESELEQASQLLSAGYPSAAAVVAGVVLETTLRELCHKHGLAMGKLDKMNADLAKVGHYNLLVQKRITALADIRNNAAHGHPDQFKNADVQDMIAYVAIFAAEHLS